MRDDVEVLWPAMVADGWSEAERPDWMQEPARVIAKRGEVQPLSSTEDVLTAETIVDRARCFLPPDTDVKPVCRVRVDGRVYEIEGTVDLRRARRRVSHKACFLRLVEA